MRFYHLLFISIVGLFCGGNALAANTYIAQQEVSVLTEPNGEQVNLWPVGSVFTGTELDEFWIEVSGVVSEGMWQPLELHRYIAISPALKLKPSTQYGEKTIIYQKLVGGNNKAKTYRVVGDTIAFLAKPEGKTSVPYETWIDSKEFTSGYQDAHYIKATGNISERGWSKFEQARWIKKPAQVQDITLPKPFNRDESAIRVAVIDKNNFDLTLYEVIAGKANKLLKTPVALGYDKCLPAEKGGQCYYTPEGQFEIDMKLFDPSGIQWCVPSKMRGEFKQQLARGENCWRGIMGRHALHFGDSLFLHGTSNPASIGSRTTHGCVRLRNADIDLIYRLMDKGDKVIVTASPETVDFANLQVRTPQPLS